jgi:nucleoside-diphosphate-sugar epimerase
MSTIQELHVIFGTGALGQSVMQQLTKLGKQVRMVNRSGKAVVPEGVEVVRGNASDSASTREVCQGATVVYNCAAPPYTDWETAYPPIQAGILEGAAAAGAKLVSAENVYVYGAVDVPMTEELPFAATTRKGQVRARMSTALMDAHKSGKVRAVIGRAPDFYGPQAVITTIYGGRVFYSALAGKPVSVFGKLDLPHTFIYVDDFAKGLVTLGDRDEALGQSWHIPSAPTLTQGQLLNLIFSEAGQPAKIGTAPNLVIQGLGLFNPLMREFAEMLYQWEKPFIVSHAKYERAFGNESTPHQQAVRQTLDWFRNNPEQS